MAAADPSGALLLPPGGGVSRDKMRQEYIAALQNCIVLLEHSAHCQAPEDACGYNKCWIAKPLWRHIQTCSDGSCTEDRCTPTAAT